MKKARFKNMEFEYEEEHLDIHELPEINKEDAVQILFKVQDLLEPKGVGIYLAWGTLLGAVRDKDFIKGDLDVDVFIKAEDEEKLFANLQYLKENRIELIRAYKNGLYSFRDMDHLGVYIDFYVVTTPHNIWGLYCKCVSGVHCVPKKFMKDGGEIEFLGRTFKCPKNPEMFLEFIYGKTWVTPIGKFEATYKYDVTTHYYWRKIRTNFSLMMKTIIGEENYQRLKALRHEG